MQEWEYLVETLPVDINSDHLNQRFALRGEDGWDFAGFFPKGTHVLWKRPKKARAEIERVPPVRKVSIGERANAV